MDEEKILGKGKGNIVICVLCNINFIVWVHSVCLDLIQLLISDMSNNCNKIGGRVSAALCCSMLSSG